MCVVPMYKSGTEGFIHFSGVIGMKLTPGSVWGEVKVNGDVGSSHCAVPREGFSPELKCNDVDHGQTWRLVAVGLSKEKMPLWNLTWHD